ncbi:uncharacterized protein [Pyrus communis]|uniref:uncharacterized protein n=1 Tax=Pyrus communis TaxID=23211 RepID=UPI0035BFB7AB
MMIYISFFFALFFQIFQIVYVQMGLNVLMSGCVVCSELRSSSGPRCVKATSTWSTVSSFTVPDDSSEPLAIPTEKEVNNSKELEGLSDPMRKDVSEVGKKIDAINKELKPLGHTCQKKKKKYRVALEFFNEKNREKVQLITKLMEVILLNNFLLGIARLAISWMG